MGANRKKARVREWDWRRKGSWYDHSQLGRRFTTRIIQQRQIRNRRQIYLTHRFLPVVRAGRDWIGPPVADRWMDRGRNKKREKKGKKKSWDHARRAVVRDAMVDELENGRGKRDRQG